VLAPDALFAACRGGRTASCGRTRWTPASSSCAPPWRRTPPICAAFIGGFHGHRLEEYRIGLCLPEGEQVVHGLVWPLLDAEDENSEIAAEIEQRLRDAGSHQHTGLRTALSAGVLRRLAARRSTPNEDGEPVRAEMPEQPSRPVGAPGDLIQY
jgi:hypothetical protein